LAFIPNAQAAVATQDCGSLGIKWERIILILGPFLAHFFLTFCRAWFSVPNRYFFSLLFVWFLKEEESKDDPSPLFHL
jgi:hypothetical protein